MEIPEDCVTVTIVCVVTRWKQLQSFREIHEKRLEVKHSGHIGFSASDAKERTNKIDVLNDEVTLKADTKLVEEALSSMKLIG